jgi:oxepin-CoA hydrolase / 3-oxo-5,6-dehydrosuberyl-CoA semialdehyde dehydrogenase
VLRAIPFDVNDADVREAFFRRWLFEALVALRDDTRPRWGRMTAQQMIEHLLWAFELSSGEAQVDCPVPEPQRPRLKAFLYDNRPTPREFMNPALTAGLPPLRHTGLADAVGSLRAAVNRFVQKAAAAPEATRTHPVFGPIGMDEWARAHFKHTYHHLLQFGLLEAEA